MTRPVHVSVKVPSVLVVVMVMVIGVPPVIAPKNTSAVRALIRWSRWKLWRAKNEPLSISIFLVTVLVAPLTVTAILTSAPPKSSELKHTAISSSTKQYGSSVDR